MIDESLMHIGIEHDEIPNCMDSTIALAGKVDVYMQHKSWEVAKKQPWNVETIRTAAMAMCLAWQAEEAAYDFGWELSEELDTANFCAHLFDTAMEYLREYRVQQQPNQDDEPR